MLELKLAKSMMENEEGMNHLWFRLLGDKKIKYQTYELQIELPKGIHRSHNLNGFVENEHDHIVVDIRNEDIIIEFFTQDAISCGEKTIVLYLRSATDTISKAISFLVVEEDEMDSVEIDEQVIERVKSLSSAAPSIDEESTIECIEPKILRPAANPFSYLEKKYRIDY